MKKISPPKTTLGEIVEFYNGKSVKASEVGEFPVYGSNGLIGFTDEFKYENGIIIGRVGAYCGSIEYCHGRFWASDNTIVAASKVGRAFNRYTAYLLVYLDLHRHAGGAAQPLLTQTNLRKVECPHHDKETQRKIAGILSAYDDLIENNTRRIAILEDMAQAIYREWFVHFRFPGHEHAKFVDSPLGRIPEGWKIQPLREIAHLRLGKMLDAKKNKGELMPYLANVNVRWGEFDLQNLREMRFESNELDAYGLKYGDIVMCEGGEPGRCAIWTEQVPGMMIQKAIHRIRSVPEIAFRYLYACLRHKGQTGQLEALFTGSTIKHLPREKLDIVTVEVPPKRLMDCFSKMIEPMACHVEVLIKRNANLRLTRDLLLPKLISGQLDVESLEIEVGKAPEIVTASNPATVPVSSSQPVTAKKPLSKAGIKDDAAVVCLLLDELIKNGTARRHSEFVIQKHMYGLAKRCRLKVNSRFIPYLYGPWSQELRDEVLRKYARKVGWIRIDQKTKVVVQGKNFAKGLAHARKLLGEQGQLVTDLVQDLRKFRNRGLGRWMTALMAVSNLKDQGQPVTLPRIQQAIDEWPEKRQKADFSVEAVEETVKKMVRRKWFALD